MGAEQEGRSVEKGGGVRLVRSTCTYICKYNHYANGPWFYINIICGLACVFPKDTGTQRAKERKGEEEKERGTHRGSDRMRLSLGGNNRLVFMSFVKFYLIFESFMKSLIFVFHASDLHNSPNTHTRTHTYIYTHTHSNDTCG